MTQAQLHRRTGFGPADPAWDEVEAGWMRTLGAGGPPAEAAWSALFRVYAGLFLRRLRGLGDGTAEEVMQELWIEIRHAAHRWRGDSPVRGFLHKILDDARRRYFKAHLGLPVHDNLSDEMVESEYLAPLFAVEAKQSPDWHDFVRCVRAAFARFELAHPRLALLLFHKHVQELSLEETAELLGGDADLAKGQVFSAREKVRPDMAPCLELWPNRGQRAT